MVAMGTNRVAIGHDSSQLSVYFTAVGAQAAVKAMTPQIKHCEGFYEAPHCNLSLTNIVYANTDDDNDNGTIDNLENSVSFENDLLSVIPLSVPECCSCEEHNFTNWWVEIATHSQNMKIWQRDCKLLPVVTGEYRVSNSETVYVEGLMSSISHAADWIDWKYYGLTKTAAGELVDTNFTVRTVWTSIDLNDAPARLEPVTVATNSAGTIVNPAGVPLNGVAVYRVEVVPEGIIPESDIHWSKNNNNVTFYGGKNWGREAYVRGQAEGDFTLEVTIDNMPADYRPHIHGKVLTPTVTPIHVYIICDADGTPAVSTNTVNVWVTEANRIYRQAAMSFTVASVEHVVNTNWFTIEDDNEFAELCSYANVSEGLELYCVREMKSVGLHSDMRLMPTDERCGIAVRANAIASALAHEIGHACKLNDLKYELDNSVDEVLVGIPNWSGGAGTGYHAPGLKHQDLVKRILMYHQAEPTITDIPLGDVAGTYVSEGGGSPKTNAVICGLDYMDDMGRNPCH